MPNIAQVRQLLKKIVHPSVHGLLDDAKNLREIQTVIVTAKKVLDAVPTYEVKPAEVAIQFPAYATALPPGNGPFRIYLVRVGENKIGAIKGVREVTGLGLKEAKDLCDDICAGGGKKAITSGITAERAAYVRRLFQSCGAEIYIEPMD